MAGKPFARHPVTQPLDTSYRYIPLTNNLNAIVDSEDYEWLSQFNWHSHWTPETKMYYAVRKTPRINLPGSAGHIRMHREIVGAVKGEIVDHKNHDSLDNRRSNLRKCTTSENSRNQRLRTNNKSGFKGVHKCSKKWIAQIRLHGKPTIVGRFRTPEEAARAYDEAAREHYGEFACTNF